jgi:hypothetical protein
MPDARRRGWPSHGQRSLFHPQAFQGIGSEKGHAIVVVQTTASVGILLQLSMQGGNGRDVVLRLLSMEDLSATWRMYESVRLRMLYSFPAT